MAEHSLTKREVEIAGHLAAGASNREIADALQISVTTVETHVKHIRAKLRIRGRGWVKSVLTESPGSTQIGD